MTPQNLDITLAQLEYYWSLYQKKTISPQDISALFWLSFYHSFPSSNFHQIQSKTKHFSSPAPSSYNFKDDDFLMNLLKLKEENPIHHLYELFNSITFKHIKTIAVKALCLWYQKKFDLVVVDFIPEPIEVLKMQTQGTRCISLLRKKEEVLKLYEHHRTVQQFLIHDLEHAWQMFSDPTLTLQQIELSKRLLRLYELGHMNFLKEHPATEQTLNYIFSDMNTHPRHTLLSLKSLVLDYFKYKQGVNKLDPKTESVFLQKWDFIQTTLITP